MRIGLDGRSLVGGPERAPRGVGRYTAALLAALAHGHPGDEWHVVLPREGELEHSTPAAAYPNVVLHRAGLPRRVLYGAGAVARRPRLDRVAGSLDVFWAPAPAPLGLDRDVPFVLTVHDLSIFERPGDFTAYERIWHRASRLRSLVARAARIIAVSPPVAARVVARWPFAAGRVEAVLSGVTPPACVPSTDASAATLLRHGIPARYILAVGALEPRKAPDLIARAHARARAGGLEADLVFAGAGRLAGDVASRGVRILGHVTDDDLDALYRGALALVMPSRDEGFGFPPLEAAVRGTPAVLSDLPAFRATLGDAALYVPTDDEDALAAALLRLAGDADLRTRLALAAEPAARELTWKRSAARTRAVLAAAATE